MLLIYKVGKFMLFSTAGFITLTMGLSLTKQILGIKNSLTKQNNDNSETQKEE
jgi:hypothetical protein